MCVSALASGQRSRNDVARKHGPTRRRGFGPTMCVKYARNSAFARDHGLPSRSALKNPGARRLEAAGVELEIRGIGNFLMARDFWRELLEMAVLAAARGLH
jgi:hypothetical protein